MGLLICMVPEIWLSQCFYVIWAGGVVWQFSPSFAFPLTNNSNFSIIILTYTERIVYSELVSCCQRECYTPFLSRRNSKTRCYEERCHARTLLPKDPYRKLPSFAHEQHLTLVCTLKITAESSLSLHPSCAVPARSGFHLPWAELSAEATPPRHRRACGSSPRFL